MERMDIEFAYTGFSAAAFIFTKTSPGARSKITGMSSFSSSALAGEPRRTTRQAACVVGIVLIGSEWCC